MRNEPCLRRLVRPQSPPRAKGCPDQVRAAPESCRTARRQLELRADGLDLGVSLEGCVAHLTTPARLLVPTEWERSVEAVVAVGPDGAGPQLLRQRVRLRD